MTKSKRLAAASADRMISFYDLDIKKYSVPVSRIEDLAGIPVCMEYYSWGNQNRADNVQETLLVGDNMGTCYMYNLMDKWHAC